MLLDVLGSAYYGPSHGTSQSVVGAVGAVGVVGGNIVPPAGAIYQLPVQQLTWLVTEGGTDDRSAVWPTERQAWPSAGHLKFDPSETVCLFRLSVLIQH